MKWILGIIGAAILLGAALVIRKSPGGGSKAVDEQLVVKVKRSDLDVIVSETGKVEPKAKAEIKSKIPGQVVSVYVKEGERVKAGQKLTQLDPIDYRRDVERAQADLEQARVQQEFAEAQLGRRQKALEGRGISPAEFDTAKNEVAVAKARIALAHVTLQSAQDKLRYTAITAPMEGVVIQRGIEPGEVVTPGVAATFEGKPLLVVADLSELKVKINLNQIDVAKVRLAQTVDVSVDALGERKFVAQVSKVAPAAVLEKGKDVETFPVEATLSGDVSAIKPGMTADVKIKVDKKPNVLLLPIEAVVTEKAKQFGRAMGAEKNWVWLVERSGKNLSTKKVDVEVGERNDREVELVKGVSEGQEILVQPPSAEANEVKM
jgi:HlyD family secretion protein/macrolide-specific efflux system membrane fusion protein